MVQSLHLSGSEDKKHPIARVNRLPLLAAGALVVIFFGVIIIGLSTRGLGDRPDVGTETSSNGLASSYAESLKRGVANGIISEPQQPIVRTSANPHSETPVSEHEDRSMRETAPATAENTNPANDRRDTESEKEWLERLQREQREQLLRERHRQEMARLQARDAAHDSPLVVEIAESRQPDIGSDRNAASKAQPTRHVADLYAAALEGTAAADTNRQASKEAFFNEDIKELGYLPNGVVPAQSHFELKRGSVIPATLISGINSDLPGRISAQVNQSIYDSATGRHLLVPQGAKLFGRYDAEVSFGQSRVLVIWTDLIFPNGSTLQIGGMAGTDAEGYAGFNDKIDRHLLRTFGSAALIALIGAGMDMSLPSEDRNGRRDNASDAARRSFAETFGRVAERTIGKHLDVQPTLRIRPGYIFNVLVEQDIIFPGIYR